MSWTGIRSKPSIQLRTQAGLMWGLEQTYLGHLLFSVSPGAKENHGQCWWDAPRRDKDVLGRVRFFYLLKEIEGKHGVCRRKFFHCFNLERKWGEKSSAWWWQEQSNTHSALPKAPFLTFPWQQNEGRWKQLTVTNPVHLAKPGQNIPHNHWEIWIMLNRKPCTFIFLRLP